MGQRIFVKVVGFSDAERHAINSLLRLSEERDTVYSLWVPGAPSAAKLSLIDGASYEAPVEIAAAGDDSDRKIIWIGADAPANAWRVFERPLHWPQVLEAMDMLYAPPPALDLDLDFDNLAETAPAPVAGPVKRVLLLEGSPEDRMYLHVKLGSVGLMNVDEAATGAQALQLAGQFEYALAVLDMDVEDVDIWPLVQTLMSSKPAVEHVILTSRHAGLFTKLRAWFSGCKACMRKPLHPGRLQRLLLKV